MSRFSIVLCLFLVIFLMADFCGATPYYGVEFPAGEISFADAVVSYIPGAGDVSDDYDNPSEALGIPDVSDGGINYVSLGDGGELILQFTDNSLTTSGNNEMDLWIFEIGAAVENMNIYIGTNITDWIFLGEVFGQPTGIDIDSIDGVVAEMKYSFVKIVDAGSPYGSSYPWGGADIDAVGAISSAPPIVDQVPEPTTMLLLGTVLTGLAGLRKKIKRA